MGFRTTHKGYVVTKRIGKLSENTILCFDGKKVLQIAIVPFSPQDCGSGDTWQNACVVRESNNELVRWILFLLWNMRWAAALHGGLCPTYSSCVLALEKVHWTLCLLKHTLADSRKLRNIMMIASPYLNMYEWLLCEWMSAYLSPKSVAHTSPKKKHTFCSSFSV